MTDDEILSTLEAIPTAEIAKRAVIVYRCPRGCALLAVFSIDGRHFGYKPRVKLSDAVNQANSVAAARAKDTIDADRRWLPYAFPLADAAGLLSAECNHVRAQVDVETVERDRAAATRQREPIRLRHNEVREVR